MNLQQLQDSPSIDHILLSIHDSIEILGIVCLQAIGAQKSRIIFWLLLLRLLLSKVILPLWSISWTSRIIFIYGIERNSHDLKSIFYVFWSVLCGRVYTCRKCDGAHKRADCLEMAGAMVARQSAPLLLRVYKAQKPTISLKIEHVGSM